MPEITLKAEKQNFNSFMDFVDSHAENIGFTGSARYKIKLATEEAIVNVINYAYSENKENITLICDQVTVPQIGLKLQVIDSGIPFDPLATIAPDTHQAIEERSIGGLGIYLIKKIANEIFYQRDKLSNILTIVFYLDDEKEK